MTVRELIKALSILPPKYQIIIGRESPIKVVVEKCGKNEYVRILLTRERIV